MRSTGSSRISRSFFPESSATGVVMMVAVGFSSLIMATASSMTSCFAISVLERTMVVANWTWLLKNSPKFFMYSLHFFASTTVTAELFSTSRSASTSATAFMTSESFPTPLGSMMIRSGLYFVRISCRELAKSPTREQQMHPEFISRISIPESFRNPPSMPISPNSFSIRTTCSPATASFRSLRINVVFPAPRKPEIMSTFVFAIIVSLSESM